MVISYEVGDQGSESAVLMKGCYKLIALQRRQQIHEQLAKLSLRSVILKLHTCIVLRCVHILQITVDVQKSVVQ